MHCSYTFSGRAVLAVECTQSSVDAAQLLHLDRPSPAICGASAAMPHGGSHGFVLQEPMCALNTVMYLSWCAACASVLCYEVVHESVCNPLTMFRQTSMIIVQACGYSTCVFVEEEALLCVLRWLFGAGILP
jgi:hypothetical protein